MYYIVERDEIYIQRLLEEKDRKIKELEGKVKELGGNPVSSPASVSESPVDSVSDLDYLN
jgi:hypothetical protein